MVAPYRKHVISRLWGSSPLLSKLPASASAPASSFDVTRSSQHWIPGHVPMMPGKNRSHQLYGKILKADKKEHTPVHIYCCIYPITKSLQVVLTLVLKKRRPLGRYSETYLSTAWRYHLFNILPTHDHLSRIKMSHTLRQGSTIEGASFMPCRHPQLGTPGLSPDGVLLRHSL
jgi:hypothetical protein